MIQSGNTIQNGNIQAFLDSAANAASYGQRQFYTPPQVAQALCRPLPAIRRAFVADLQFGNGALAAGAGAKTAIGLDIDHRVRSELKPPADARWLVEEADLTHWYGIAAEADLRLPFILVNPPFSLQWYADRLTALADSDLPEVSALYRKFPKHIDSTLATFMIALDRLTYNGEGFLVCNGNTARRFLGDPDGNGKSPVAAGLMRYIWMWLEIPGFLFDNQMTDFPTAVLYFSRSHGSSNRQSTINNQQSSITPLFLRAETGDPLSIERALMTPEVFTACRGSRHTYEHEFNVHGILEKFEAVTKEYGVRHKAHKPTWNIMLDEKGRLRTHLTPFQKVSKRIQRQTIENLHELNLKTPISLCVTATSRTVLREAAQCGIWRIQPEVSKAIDEAMREFEDQGAPFYPPTGAQPLGWVDEHSSLVCRKQGIGDCQPGDVCPISGNVEPTTWKGLKTNLAGDPEDLEYHGQELLVTLTDPKGVKHHFHVRKDDSLKPAESENGRITAIHWHIADLLEHFHIPTPQDIVAIHPERYQENLRILDMLEARACKHMAKAALPN